MRQVALCIALVLTFSLSANGVETIAANDPNIQYTGRIDFADPLSPIMYWPGSYIIANFEGTSINVKLHDYGDNYFYVIIDDGDPNLINLSPGAGTYTAATGLTDSVHRIMLFKRTETPEGQAAFTGFELDDGKGLLPPPERPQRRIEFYGDSITSGFSVDCTCNNAAAEYKNNYYAYSAVTARNLNAEFHCISVSGIGLYVDTWGLGGNMQTLYYDKLYYEDESTYTMWDFSQWTPHIVVVNLGQNDYLGAYTQAGAEQAYRDFSMLLRNEYPYAHIILALGSMNATQTGSPWPGYLQNAVNDLNTIYNDPKVYSVIFPYSGDPHPDVARHAVMATQLTDFINNNIPDSWLGSVDMNGDRIVNPADFGKFGLRWLDSDCDLCEGADLSGDSTVDVNDLKIMANNWLIDFTLKGHWKLDGDGTDSSSYNHFSTIYGSPTWDPNGITGQALVCDGGDDYIKIDNFMGIPGGQSRTVSAWIQTSQDDGEILTFGQMTTTGGRWVFQVAPGGKLNVQVGGETIFGTTVITDGFWHHVAAVLENDGTPSLDEVKLYVDGTEEAVPGTATEINTILENEVKIGVFSDTAKYFEGLIDEVRIYSRALSQAEIDELFNMGQ